MSKQKNFLVTFLSSGFMLWILTLLDYLSIGCNLYLKESHGMNLEKANTIIFFVTTIVAQCLFGGLSKLKAGACGGVVFESIVMVRELHSFFEKNTASAVESFTNAYLSILISTLIFGVVSYFLGVLKLKKWFNCIPKLVLCGVMASIGLQILKDGFDQIYATKATYWIHGSAIITLVLVLLAYVIEQRFPDYVFFIPLYLSCITALFYGVFYLLKLDMNWLRSESLILNNKNNLSGSFFDVFKLVRLDKINISLVLQSFPRILKIALTNMIHITVNIPGFSSAMKIKSSIDDEFKVQGISNLFCGFLGFPVYFINSTSILFNKNGGRTKIHAVLAGISMVGLFFIAPKMRELLPVMILAFFPIYIGGAFIISNVIEYIFNTTLLDLSVILVSAFVGYYDPVYGLIIGIFYQAFIILISYYIWFDNKVVDSTSYYDKIKMNYESIKIDYLVFPLTYEKFISSLNIEAPKVLIDMRECPFIDHDGNNILINKLNNIKAEVLILGRPQNLYVEQFRSNLI